MATPNRAVFLCNGVDLASSISSFEPSGEREMLDATSIANEGFKTWESSYKEVTLSVDGYFDHDGTTEDKIANLWGAAIDSGDTQVITASYGAVTAGAKAFMMDTAQMEYSTDTPVGELITVSGEFKGQRSGDAGVWLMHALQAAGTNNGSTVDNAAATTNGGFFQVHLHNDDASDVDVKLQHSTNGTDWTDVTSAVVSNLSATRAAGSYIIPAGTTINRYARAVATVTGGDTFMVSAALSRRL